MPQQSRQAKPYASYIGGLWTESTPLNFPENTVSKTTNFKYNPDGSIERRLGLAVTDDVDEPISDCCVVESHRWSDPGNSVDLEIIAVQFGNIIQLYRETGDCDSDYEELCRYDLNDYRVNDTEICDYPVDFASGHGKLFISHKAIQPQYITYNDGDDCSNDPLGCTIHSVDIYERDFEGVDDGLANDECPTELTQAHRYNLYNQGWTDEYIELYYEQSIAECEDNIETTTECEWVVVDVSDNEREWVCTETEVTTETSCEGCYPANNERWQMGLYIDPDDGKEKWSLEELKKSSFGSTTVARGHFIRNIFDTCDVFTGFGRSSLVDALLRPTYITLVFDTPHNYVTGDTVEVVGSVVVITDSAGNETFSSYDGVYTVGVDSNATNAYHVRIPLTEIGANIGDTISITNIGDVVTQGSGVDLVDCCVSEYRPEVVGLYAGRVWYAGIHNQRLGNRIYFSQVLRDDSNIGRMYQQNDPTSEDFNELLKTDGGFIEIPELGRVMGLKNLKDGLLVFADNGIWAVTGGTYEYFAADSYSVSKLTEVGVVSKKSIEEAEDTWVYAANRGIYIISSDQRVTNITQKAIHRRYRKIPTSSKQQIDIVYNPYDKTLHVLHHLEDDCWKYCSELILNHRIEAWYEYVYQTHEIHHSLITGNDSDDHFDQMYLVDTDGRSKSYFMSDCYFKDWVGEDDEIIVPAYLKTAPETLGDLSVDKKIIELSFFLESNNGVQGKFRGNWDWSCMECANKWTDIKDLANIKNYCDNEIPTDVVRTDYKSIKGYGRAFEYEFSTVDDKPLTIYGWSAVYEAKP